MAQVIYTSQYVNQRLQTKVKRLLCQSADLYKRGKKATEIEKKLALLGFAMTFLPYWDTEFIKEVDRYFNGHLTA